ncbi:MAG: hypothetical protein AAB019_05915 [Planctomycetota bacterium]
MNEERMKILEILKEGKITVEEAQELLEGLREKEVDVVGGDGAHVKVRGHLKDKGAPKGFFYWLFNKTLFSFIPMVLGFGLGAGVLFCLLYYLPFHLAADKLLIIYGILGVLALCATLIAISAIGIGRLAVKRGIKSGSNVIGGSADEKPKTE